MCVTFSRIYGHRVLRKHLKFIEHWFTEKPETVQPADGQVLCKVCGDIANGIHFGVNTCEGCKVISTYEFEFR